MNIPGNLAQTHAVNRGTVEAQPVSSPVITARQAVSPVHAAHISPVHGPAPAAVPGQPQLRAIAAGAARFLLHYAEMLLAMAVGMGLFHGLAALTGDAGPLGPGTDLHRIGMAVFMLMPMVGWMRIRGHGWRHIAEMAVAMLLPMAAVVVLCRLGADASLPWLAGAGMPAMYVGMLAAMLYRLDLYTGHAGHHAHAA